MPPAQWPSRCSNATYWPRDGQFLAAAILPLMIVGAVTNDSPALGGILGLVVGVFAGGFLCGPLAILISIRSDVARIADAIESQNG